MTIGKDLRKLFKPQNIVIIAGIIIIGFALCYYGNQKNLTQQGFSENTISNSMPPTSSENSVPPLGTPSILPDDAAPVNMGLGSQVPVVPPPNCTQQPVLNPADLLPKEGGGTGWNEAAPSSNGAMNFLDSGYLAGINTVSGSLRNANQQLRSEPPNPTSLVSPWMNSTIEPDLMRAPFEIGCGCPGDSRQ
tara:strand:+ start:5438 stop:6010 length:573 start_codon:yes stop_codon:yes gene_type:complete